jgi:phenylalanyl-tRNA synthetase beta chain
MLMNPLSADLNCMRQTLLFGGLENISYNINRKNPNLAFYEFGNCYYYNGKAEQTAENPLKPYSEDYHLGMWLTGMKSEQNWAQAQQKASFYTLRAYVNNIFKRLGIKQEKTKVVEYSDDLLSYGLQITTSNGKVLVTLGIVSKDLCKKMDISQEVEYADVNWTALMGEMKNHNVTYHDIPKYPEVKRDLALLIDKKTTFAEIEKIARDTEKKLLKEVYLFDVYEGKTLDFGKKSYAVSFILQDEEKTLTDSQIDGIMNKLIKNFETKLEAKIR